MRIILKLSKNTEPIPFEYQSKLTGCIHKWIGKDNEEHGNLSFYSFSWLKGTEKKGNSLTISREGEWRISAYNNDLIKQIISSIGKDNLLFSGIRVKEIIIQQTPEFEGEQYFNLGSPILIKLREGDRQKFYYFSDKESDELLTLSLKNKLAKCGLDSKGVKVWYDKNYLNPKTKPSKYKGITNIGSMCPVHISGTPEQISFAWNVGLGNSTGIGFGFLQ